MLSYRKQLKEIGETGSRISYRSFFCVKKDSFRETMEAMTSPRPKKWTKPAEYKKSGVTGFLDECQGVTHDGKDWFFTSNGIVGRQGIYKYNNNMKRVGSLIFSGNPALLAGKNIPTGKINGVKLPKIGHVGDPDYYKGKIYIPVQGDHGFLAIDSSLDPASAVWYETKNIGDSHPWCAVNRWNGRLYTSKFNGQNLSKFEIRQKLYAYNIDNIDKGKIEREESYDIILKLPSQRVQGGCVTEDGTLLLSSDAKKFENKDSSAENRAKYDWMKRNHDEIEPSITCYSVINGHYYGKIGIMREGYQEVEGLTYWAKKEDGKDTHLHVVLLQNKWPIPDGIFFKHYAAPK